MPLAAWNNLPEVKKTVPPKDKFDVEKLKENAKKVNPKITFFEVSATSGEGMEAWYGYLKSQL